MCLCVCVFVAMRSPTDGALFDLDTVFRSVDLEGSGSLDKASFVTAMAALEIFLSDDEVDSIFKQLDPEPSKGFIQYATFLSYLKKNKTVNEQAQDLVRKVKTSKSRPSLIHLKRNSMDETTPKKGINLLEDNDDDDDDQNSNLISSSSFSHPKSSENGSGRHSIASLRHHRHQHKKHHHHHHHHHGSRSPKSPNSNAPQQSPQPNGRIRKQQQQKSKLYIFGFWSGEKFPKIIFETMRKFGMKSPKNFCHVTHK